MPNPKDKTGELQIETSKSSFGDGEQVVKFCKALHNKDYRFQKGDRVSQEDPVFIQAFDTVKKKIGDLNFALGSMYEAVDGYMTLDIEGAGDKDLYSALQTIAKSKQEDHLSNLQTAAKGLLKAFYGQGEGVKVEPIAKASTPAGVAALKGLSSFFKRSTAQVRTFKLRKDQGGTGKIEEERYVLGVVLEPNDGSDGHPEKADTDGDIYNADEVRKAAHWYMENGKLHGVLHGTEFGGVIYPMGTDKIVLLENYVTPVDLPVGALGVGSLPIKKGTWLMGLRINDDDLWQQVKDGELDGLSIGGVAIETPINPEPSEG